MNTALYNVLAIVDEMKCRIREGDYLTLCNHLKDMYGTSNEETSYHTIKELYEEISSIRTENFKLRKHINALNIFVGINIFEVWHTIHKLAMNFCSTIPNINMQCELLDIKQRLRFQQGQTFNNMGLYHLIVKYIKSRINECAEDVTFLSVLNVRPDMTFRSTVQNTIMTNKDIRNEMIDANVDIIIEYVNVFREYHGMQLMDENSFRKLRL